ncbi:unnamed protein product [Nyctereutes procyonoides]|uniref:(raccoon dog) hypothetical protein n=1 Tax=Nyctereutes procyonoides TaxID=34880 RepID=A0A811XXE9_NYCPR|nr:unnamed protein product [Nyctereutes procyonoides]
MTAQRRARRRRGRGPRPAARHSQSEAAPGSRWPISGRRAAANRGARGAGAQLGAAGHGSAGRRRGPPRGGRPPAPAPAPPTSRSVCRPVQWAEVLRRRTQTRAALRRALSSASCAPRARVEGAGRGPGSRRAPPRAEEPRACGHLPCAGWCGAPGEEGAEPDPQDLPPSRGRGHYTGDEDLERRCEICACHGQGTCSSCVTHQKTTSIRGPGLALFKNSRIPVAGSA